MCFSGFSPVRLPLPQAFLVCETTLGSRDSLGTVEFVEPPLGEYGDKAISAYGRDIGQSHALGLNGDGGRTLAWQICQALQRPLAQ
jgi:hypothetical protein